MKPLSPKAQSAVDRIIERFKTGDLGPIKQVATFKLPDDHPAAKWTFRNQVLAYAQGDTLDCRGFEGWKDVGRQVVKGGHAAFIFRPCFARDTTDEEGKPKVIGYAPVPVFPATQTEGDPAGLVQVMPAVLPPLYDVAQACGITTLWGISPEAARGDCAVDGSKIRLATDDPKTFYHELGHAMHARIQGKKLQGGQHADQETVADFTACVLAELYGAGDYTANVWSYISAYNPDPLKAIEKSLGTVEAVLAEIEALAGTPIEGGN